MIGVRKDSGVIRLLMAAALVLFVAACSSSSDNTAKRERDQAREQVQELEGTVTELTGSLEELRGQLTALQESGTPADQATIEALNARIKELEDAEAKRIADAIAKEAAAAAKRLFPGIAAQLDTDTANDFVGVPSVTARYGSPATVAQGDATTLTTNARNAEIGKAKGDLLPAVGPWSGTMVGSQDKEVTGKPTDTVVVYTDVDAGETESFIKRFSLANADAELAILTDGTHDGFIDTNVFSTRAGLTTHGDPDKAAEDLVIPGTFANAPGHYRCDEGVQACTSLGRGTKGVRMGAGWTFDPDAGAMAYMPDGEYGHFGWWLRVDEDDKYVVDVFHGYKYETDTAGNRPDTTTFTALQGSADYEGPAAGKFAINSQFPGPGTLSGGHFTATASLTANFESDSVSGSIHSVVAARPAG